MICSECPPKRSNASTTINIAVASKNIPLAKADRFNILLYRNFPTVYFANDALRCMLPNLILILIHETLGELHRLRVP